MTRSDRYPIEEAEELSRLADADPRDDAEWQDHQEEQDVLHACTRLVPERRITRDTLAEFLNTDPEWVDRVVKRLVDGGTLQTVDGEIQPPVL